MRLAYSVLSIYDSNKEVLGDGYFFLYNMDVSVGVWDF